jgi:hypothetical protein
LPEVSGSVGFGIVQSVVEGGEAKLPKSWRAGHTDAEREGAECTSW